MQTRRKTDVSHLFGLKAQHGSIRKQNVDESRVVPDALNRNRHSSVDGLFVSAEKNVRITLLCIRLADEIVNVIVALHQLLELLRLG